MDTLIIFGATYLVFLSALFALVYIVRAPRETQKKILVFAVLSFALAYLLAILASNLYYNPRPFVVGGFEPLVAHEPDNGFPSDHTLLAAAIAALFLFFNKRLTLALWIIAILVALSRVYAGVHHPIDVLASMTIALIAAFAVSYTYGRRQ